MAPFLLFQNSLEYVDRRSENGCLLQNSLEKNILPKYSVCINMQDKYLLMNKLILPLRKERYPAKLL